MWIITIVAILAVMTSPWTAVFLLSQRTVLIRAEHVSKLLIIPETGKGDCYNMLISKQKEENCSIQ